MDKNLQAISRIFSINSHEPFATRVKEHGNSQSAIHEHFLSCQNCKLNFSHSCFDVIDSGKNNFETTVKEALHIKLKETNVQQATIFTWFFFCIEFVLG